MALHHTRAGRVTLVVALVALAGCSGFLGADGGAGGSTPADVVTPAPVPSGTAAGTPPTFRDAPPGIGPDGRVNADRLRETHRRILANRSFTMRVRANGGGSGTAPFEQVYAVANRSTYLVRAGADGPSVRYVDSTGRFERSYAFRNGEVVLTGEVTVAVTYGSPLPLRGLVHLGARNPDVTRIERESGVFYRIHSTEPPRELAGVSNYSMTAYVRADGLVKTIDVSYDGQGIGGDVVADERAIRGTDRVDRRWTYSAVGSTDVSEPAWVRRAKRDPSTRGDERYPPGIDENGLVDPYALWDAHQFYLRNRSFTLVRSGDDGWNRLPATGTVAVQNASTYLVTRHGRAIRYSDPTGTYHRMAGSRSNAMDDGYVVVTEPDRHRLLMTVGHGARWLTIYGSSVTRVERNGTTLFRLVMTRPPDGAPIDHEKFTATALVRKSGLIERITLDFRTRVATGDGGPGGARNGNRVSTDVTYRYEYRQVGNTTVTEPAWVRAAKRNRTATPTERAVAPPSTVLAPTTSREPTPSHVQVAPPKLSVRTKDFHRGRSSDRSCLLQRRERSALSWSRRSSCWQGVAVSSGRTT